MHHEHHRMDTSELRGRKVIDSRGVDIGEIKDLVIDSDTWRVDSLVVEVGRDVADDLRLDKPLLGGGPRLNVSVDRVSAMGDNVILSVDRDEMATLLLRE